MEETFLGTKHFSYRLYIPRRRAHVPHALYLTECERKRNDNDTDIIPPAPPTPPLLHHLAASVLTRD